jgi:hypothetical protein
MSPFLTNAFYLFGSAGVIVVVDVPHGCLHSDDLPPKIFLNGHSPPLQQPDKNMATAASNSEVKIDFLMFIYITPFVR